MAAGRAQSLAGDSGNAFGALADFYGGMASIPTDEINAAARNISGISDEELSPRDQALRAAARSVAEQVLSAPDPASLTQGTDSNSTNEEITSEQAAAAPTADQPGAALGATPRPVIGDAAVKPASGAGGQQDADSSFNSFVTTSRSKLDEIDGLLTKESN
jgi:chemotaxis protein MotC